MTTRSTSPRAAPANRAARALERFIRHVLGEEVTIRPTRLIEDADWSWHVGLDSEATGIANDLWNGQAVAQERLARILWLGVLEFRETTRVLPRRPAAPSTWRWR
ncbi:DUF6352 family protein [Teichococcus aestuarii]|uniref:DUF6352 family protein n=1 Tax=Teichococcus aestuarii TaxID=568898 RepID=UPI00361EC06F